jgi:propanol-preferring alcohol dehydrogenase
MPAMKSAETMEAMILSSPGAPLALQRIAVPEPSPEQVLVRVRACGVCRTDLHVFDGELTTPKLPLVLGHEIVGTVVHLGSAVKGIRKGERIGIPWLGWTCGECRWCRTSRENLCDRAQFTGYTLDGGFAQYTVVDQRYCFALPESYSDTEIAPLLCAGLIGYRSYRMAGGDAERIGIYGFGAAAHIITQVAVSQGRRVYAFTRRGDAAARAFALRIGAVWAGDSTSVPPEPLDAAVLFAPAGELVVAALRATTKGATIVCGGIHMSDIPSFPYRLLWEERVVRSVANLTRDDATDFLSLAAKFRIRTTVEALALREANTALERLRRSDVSGAFVLAVP